MLTFRVILVIATAIFVAFHSQIFISRIEPNLIFSWMASFLIEGFLISLALQRTLLSRILLIPLFFVSVLAASASFIAKNEQLLNQFLTQKRLIQQIQSDISETQKAYNLGEKYITKTLQRERQLNDELRAILKNQHGDITLIQAFIFFILVLVMQTVSIYTAIALKQELREKVSEVSKRSFLRNFKETFLEIRKLPTETLETFHDKNNGSGQEFISEVSEVSVNGNAETSNGNMETFLSENEKKSIVTELKNLKDNGKKLAELTEEIGISKSTLSKILSYPQYQISDETFLKLKAFLFKKV